jgi:hypothetical protein
MNLNRDQCDADKGDEEGVSSLRPVTIFIMTIEVKKARSSFVMSVFVTV